MARFAGGLPVDGWSRIVVLTIGGALGVNARYWMGVWIAHRTGPRFPWSTVAINATGSFAIGVAAVLLSHRWPHPLARLFVVTGFLGGYTTFSAFAFESLTMWERGDRGLSMANTVGSVILGLAAVALGVALGRAMVGSSADDDRLAHHRGHVLERADSVELPDGEIEDGQEDVDHLVGDREPSQGRRDRDDRRPLGQPPGPDPMDRPLEDGLTSRPAG